MNLFIFLFFKKLFVLCKSEREREREIENGVWVSQLELIKTTQLNVVCE